MKARSTPTNRNVVVEHEQHDSVEQLEAHIARNERILKMLKQDLAGARARQKVAN